jgi:hypothetical protein
MSSLQSLPSSRPAETLTGLTAAVVAILVATTGMSTALATALVVVVGALSGVVSSIVSAVRSTGAGVLLVELTPQVEKLAASALDAAAEPGVSPTDKTTTLKNVADSLASWQSLLVAESGVSAAANQKAAGKPAGLKA